MTHIPTTTKQGLDARAAAISLAGKIRKQFTADIAQRAVDTDARTVKFVITTDAVDREGDVIDPSGWDVAEFLKNPVVLWAHDYGQLPVARALDITPTANGLSSTAQFPPKGVHPFADTVFELIAGGFLNASSVGFRPTEATPNYERGGMDFTKQSLLEWSVVPVPANGEALAAAKAKGIDITPIVGWARGVLKSAAVPAKLAPGERVLTSREVRDLATHPEGALVEPTEHNQSTDDLDRDKIDICEACGVPLQDGFCPHCSGEQPKSLLAQVLRAPDAMATALLPRIVAVQRAVHDQPAQVTVGSDGARLRTHQAPDSDPVRWNRQLSKVFDVEGEPLEPQRLEFAWASRYLEAPVQQLGTQSVFVPAARMGSFLSAMDEGLAEWKVDALRNITDSGRETPPVFEHMQLSSTLSRQFLVEGIRFMRRAADTVKLVAGVQPTWSGLYLTLHYRADQAPVANQLVERLWRRAGELNYLKGEAFTLSGEFLDRGELDWPDIFLEAKNEKVLRRLCDRVNDEGEDMESRGLLVMGPPGTGKTLGARVMMRQAQATFIWVSARDFYRAGAFSAFSYAFDLAAECAPTILCFEDVDNYMHGEVIDLLKTEMDGMKRRRGITTIMTTNFPELVPDALIDRPGRFHDVIEIDLPTEECRLRMLSAWLPEVGTEALSQAAKDCDGYSGAHIRELCSFARTLQHEDGDAMSVALGKALAKIREQRELVAALREAPDYRPRRQVRTLVAATAARHKRLAAVVERGEAADGPVLELQDGEPVLELSAEPDEGLLEIVDEETVGRAEVDAVLRDAVVSAIRAEVRQQTQVALARARGRVD